MTPDQAKLRSTWWKPRLFATLIAALMAAGVLAQADPPPTTAPTTPATAPTDARADGRTDTRADSSVTPEKRLELAQAALMQARAQAAREYHARPEYQAALKAVQTTFNNYNDKRNALVADLAKKDPRIADFKKQEADFDTAINDACRPNSPSTPEQIDELYQKKETVTRSWRTIENDMVDRGGLAAERKAWTEASTALAGLNERESDEVEKSDAVKSAVVAVRDAEANLATARPAPPPDPDPVDDYLRQFPRAGLDRNVRELDPAKSAPAK